jgi:hypothetical protein
MSEKRAGTGSFFVRADRMQAAKQQKSPLGGLFVLA